MPQISNKEIFGQDDSLSMEDFLIGTDSNSPGKKTKTFALGGIFSLFNNFLGYNAFLFISQHNQSIENRFGYFYANDINGNITTNFQQAKKLVFSYKDSYGFEIGIYIQTIINSGQFLFKLTNFQNKDNFVFITPSNFLLSENGRTFSIDIALNNYLSNGNFIDKTKYLLGLEFISNNLTPTPISFMELRIIARGGGNTTGTDQPGDFVEGWGTWDSDTNTGVYWDKAIWNGGNRSDRANYTVLQFTEIGT
ncbi:MAG: hypothetical protein RIQ59_550 [Bacteroidota bacterium]|jgi:hypothetical protein